MEAHTDVRSTLWSEWQDLWQCKFRPITCPSTSSQAISQVFFFIIDRSIDDHHSQKTIQERSWEEVASEKTIRVCYNILLETGHVNEQSRREEIQSQQRKSIRSELCLMQQQSNGQGNQQGIYTHFYNRQGCVEETWAVPLQAATLVATTYSDMLECYNTVPQIMKFLQPDVPPHWGHIFFQWDGASLDWGHILFQ